MMAPKSLQFTFRRMMIFVAIMGLVFAAYRVASELQYSTMSHGWNTSVLPVGLEVKTIEDARFHESTIAAGTRGIVVFDPPDEDSAYPHRDVGVQLLEGPGKGARIDVKRTSLRAR